MNESTTLEYPGFFKGKNISSRITYGATNHDAAKLIDQIWLTGSLSAKDNATAKLHLNLLMADGNRKEFVSSDLQKISLEDLLTKADEWIESQLKN
jgi:hypothetical protein